MGIKKKTKKKKSFYFEDYNEAEIQNDYINLKKIKIPLNRITILSFIFFSLIFIFSIKIIYLSLTPEKSFFEKDIVNNFLKRRDIVDRNGSVLATNVSLYNIGIRPKLLNEREKKNLLIKLSLLDSELDISRIKKKIKKKDFFW